MTGAHLGGRGAGRQRGNTAEIATRVVGRRRGHRDGRHHPRPQRGFFSQNSDRRVTFIIVTKYMLMDHPHRFLSGPIGGPCSAVKRRRGGTWARLSGRRCLHRRSRGGGSGGSGGLRRGRNTGEVTLDGAFGAVADAEEGELGQEKIQ